MDSQFSNLHIGMEGQYGGADMSGHLSDIQPPMPGEYQEARTVMVDGRDRFGVTSVAFDSSEELLWMGNQGGHVTSYLGQDLQKYSSFQVHQTNEIRQILTMDEVMISLTANEVRWSNKTGRRLGDMSNETTVDMQCLLMNGPNTILLAGHQQHMLELDIGTNQIVRQVEIEEPGYAIFRRNAHSVFAGDIGGKVSVLDPSTLKVEHKLDAHSGTLSDFDVHGNLLVTCGFGNRMGNLAIDRFLMIFDMRVMRAMSPMSVMLDPMFLRFVPTYNDRIAVVSQTGQFQLLEQSGSLNSMMMYHVNTEGAPLIAFDISSSCQNMAFGDSGGYLHLFSTGENAVVNSYSKATEFPTVEHIPPISITDQLTPMSLIAMQYPISGKLLSEWPENLCTYTYRKPMPLDNEVLRTMKIVQNVGYARNPGGRRRNQAPYKLEKSPQSGRERKQSVPDSPLGRGDDPFIVVPKKYRRVEVKYSKLGLEDFDFRHYNKTNFAGLETHIPNAYCNCMLQVLYFLDPFRAAMLSHLCEKEFCLACEFGFLFHMLDQQKGKTCQASNFLRAFRTIPEAAALGVVLSEAEEAAGKANLPRLVQSWNRFILQQVHLELVEAEEAKKQPKTPLSEIHSPIAAFPKLKPFESLPEKPVESKEEKTEDGEKEDGEKKEEEEKKDELQRPVIEPIELKDSIVTQLYSTEVVNTFTCRCGEKMVRSVHSTSFDLNYRDCFPEGSSQEPLQFSFADVVQHSLSLEQPTQAWCNVCDRYQPHIQNKSLQTLPGVLALNCHLESLREWEFWKTQQDLLQSKEEGADAFGQAAIRNTKACRYGNACTRKGCKFRHENEELNNIDLDLARLNEDLSHTSWVPEALRLHMSKEGNLAVQNVSEGLEATYIKDSIEYELYGTVAHVQDPKTGGNLVSHVKVGTRYHKHKENVSCTQWYLFNDFSITPIEVQEATYFNMEWKIPCQIYYIRKDLTTRYKSKVVNPITADWLFQDASLVTPRRKHVTFTPLDETELPHKGDVVGLDAEFVTLNQEEAELRSDGTRSTIKPSQMSVARVTCVRGYGPLDGEPFIDDYISTQEQVVDYLTQFSGIKPGDLDASISSKHLTTLKSTYIKLRYLLDAGVVFVGHGLKKDFRVINLVVPKDQVMDTVELFHMPHKRMISLKFLAWHFLGLQIQFAMHDSIEDARTALGMCKKYKAFKEEGPDKIREVIKELYEKGRKLTWKIPQDDSDDYDKHGENVVIPTPVV